MVKITPDHRIAGHQAQNHTSGPGTGVFARISDRLGAGRGLRQGCGSTIKIQLFPSFLNEIFRALAFARRDFLPHCTRLIPCDNSALPW